MEYDDYVVFGGKFDGYTMIGLYNNKENLNRVMWVKSYSLF